MSDFGAYGGRYVPETLIPALDELDAGWREAQQDESFRAELPLFVEKALDHLVV